jgi:GH15 family glucan-1,4-alpha-glucosidase
VLKRGFDDELGSCVQAYGSKRLDASLLTIPLYGFLPPDDPRVRGTLEAVRRELLVDGFVQRYRHDEEVEAVDGLPPGEGAFFLCSFWFVDNLVLLGELDEACELFDRLLALRNELGLLSEEYDARLARLVGNFPQAFSHIGLVNTALRLDAALRDDGR